MAGHVKKPKNKEPIKVVASDEFDSEARLDGYGEVKFEATDQALTIAKQGNKFLILKVEVNANTLSAGAVKVLDTADSKMEANEKFKINVVKLGII